MRVIYEDDASPDLTFESLRWFMLLEATRWSHLPVGGGWYDQHPLFVEEIQIIFSAKGEVERRKNANNDPNQGRRAAAREYAQANADGIPVVR